MLCYAMLCYAMLCYAMLWCLLMMSINRIIADPHLLLVVLATRTGWGSRGGVVVFATILVWIGWISLDPRVTIPPYKGVWCLRTISTLRGDIPSPRVARIDLNRFSPRVAWDGMNTVSFIARRPEGVRSWELHREHLRETLFLEI